MFWCIILVRTGYLWINPWDPVVLVLLDPWPLQHSLKHLNKVSMQFVLFNPKVNYLQNSATKNNFQYSLSNIECTNILASDQSKGNLNDYSQSKDLPVLVLLVDTRWPLLHGDVCLTLTHLLTNAMLHSFTNRFQRYLSFNSDLLFRPPPISKIKKSSFLKNPRSHGAKKFTMGQLFAR